MECRRATGSAQKGLIFAIFGKISARYYLLAINKDTRIKAIQGYKSWITIVEKLTSKELTKFNQLIIDNNLIIEGILQENQYILYANYLKENPQPENASTAKSLTGRMADYTAVPSDFFNEYSEIWIFRTTVIIINWNEEIAIEITNEQIMGFLSDMFEFVKMGGKKVNHEEEMRKVMEK